jgi:hypothetical protein
MTKKQMKAKNNEQRVRATFNIGQRTHKSAKDYDRKKLKKDLTNSYTFAIL